MADNRFKGFRFKQFSVQHDKCAMKVSTDSIALGSWCEPGEARHILDIGAGSGLLSLMLAQKSSVETSIIAVEPDEAAADQALANIQHSPWPEKVSVFNASLQEWAKLPDKASEIFDLIISNPPWFEYAPSQQHNADNQSRNKQRTIARQQCSLDLKTLLSISTEMLSEHGALFLILPASAGQEVSNIATEVGIYPHKILNLFSKPNSEPYAVLYRFTKQRPASVIIESLVIRDCEGNYTLNFKALCRDYYLYF